MAGSKRNSKRKQTTKWLSDLLLKHAFHVPGDPRFYWAREVTLENKAYEPCKPPEIRVDFMQFVPVNQTPGGIDRGEFVCYEVKSCMADFKSDHGHNLVGDRNYYVMTQDLLDELRAEDPHLKQLTPNLRWGARAGVYVPRSRSSCTQEEYEKLYRDEFPSLVTCNPTTGLYEFTDLVCISKAEKNLRRNYSTSELLFAMLRSAGRDRYQYLDDYWRDEL